MFNILFGLIIGILIGYHQPELVESGMNYALSFLQK